MWPYLSEALSYCRDVDIKSVVYTTGIPPEKQNTLNKKLASKIIVSLFGADSKSHENITRINGSFAATINAIETFQQENIPIGIHFVVMNPNWRQLDGVVKLAKNLGVEVVSLLRFVPHGRGKMVSHFNLGKRELCEFRNKVMRLRESAKITIRLGSPFNILMLSQNVDCTAACDKLIVGSDGYVYPCDAFKNFFEEGKIDSVNNNSLIKVWRDSVFLCEVRSIIAKGLGPDCSVCKNSILCKGGCLAQKAIRTGDYFSPDPDCLRGFTGGI